MEIKKTALIGMGAIGAVYGYALHKKYGGDFAVIAGGARGERLKGRGVTLNGETFRPRVIAPGENGFAADLVILAVKNYSLREAIADIRSFVGEKTAILPLLNGITARDELQRAFPRNPVFYGLCIYVDAVRTEKGVVNVSNGIIQFGNADNTHPTEEVVAVKHYLEAAGLTADACPDMMRALWNKWMINVGCNQVSAATGSPYGRLKLEPNRVLLHEAMMEVVALANACGVSLSESDARTFEEKLRTLPPAGKTSMLQDVEAGRKTEVDYFAGTALKLGEKYGVSTPVNHVLYYLLKSKELPR